MGGIDREIILDTRHIAKHLPDTPQVQRLLKRGRFGDTSVTACSLVNRSVIESLLKRVQVRLCFMER